MAGRVFVTGDTHGSYDIRKLASRTFKSHVLDKDDYLVICGDFGLVFNPVQSSGEEEYWLRWLRDKSFTTLFVDGNHENFDRLNALPERTWHGGCVHVVNESVLHLMRGYVFDIANHSCFVMGGACSHDREYRVESISWWPQELPSEEEYARARASLDTCDWEVDYAFTHCAPANLQARVNPTFSNDALTEFLFEVERRLSYRCWFFGHYHDDRVIDERARVLYQDIVELPPPSKNKSTR